MEWLQLQEEDTRLHNQLAQLEKWKKQQIAISQQYHHAKKERMGLERLIAEVHSKVEALEDDSFINRIRQLFRKGESVEEYMRIAAERELKLFDVLETEKDLNEQIEQLKKKINQQNEKELRVKIDINKVKMKSWLKEHNAGVSERLQQLVEREELSGDLIREIEEAIYAGENAKRALIEAFKEMDSAKKYSTWDTFFGGGLFATYEKHERIRVGNTYIHSAQRYLQQFYNELLDIEDISYKTIEVNTDGLVKFADYFFDDIFSAYAVHQKVEKALFYTQRSIDEVSEILNMLQGKLMIAELEKQNVAEEIQELLKTTQQ